MSLVFYWLEPVTRPAQLKVGGVFGSWVATLVGVECILRKRRNCCAAILGDYLPHLKHNLHENSSKEEEKGSLNNRVTYVHLTLCLHRKQILNDTRKKCQEKSIFTGVGSHSLLQGIFSTQGSNLGLLHCRWILYHLSHQGSR